MQCVCREMYLPSLRVTPSPQFFKCSPQSHFFMPPILPGGRVHSIFVYIDLHESITTITYFGYLIHLFHLDILDLVTWIGRAICVDFSLD